MIFFIRKLKKRLLGIFAGHIINNKIIPSEVSLNLGIYFILFYFYNFIICPSIDSLSISYKYLNQRRPKFHAFFSLIFRSSLSQYFSFGLSLSPFSLSLFLSGSVADLGFGNAEFRFVLCV